MITVDTIDEHSTVVIVQEDAGVVVVSDEDIIVHEEAEVVVVLDGIVGPRGAQGIEGQQGIPGLAGVSYIYTQSIASDTWVIAHGLGRYPSLVVMDSGGDEVEGKLNYDSSNQLTVTFSASISGTAYLN